MHFVKVIKSKCLNSFEYSLSLSLLLYLSDYTRNCTCTHIGTHFGMERDREMPLSTGQSEVST